MGILIQDINYPLNLSFKTVYFGRAYFCSAPILKRYKESNTRFFFESEMANPVRDDAMIGCRLSKKFSVAKQSLKA
jgi:hypothetical protein